MTETVYRFINFALFFLTLQNSFLFLICAAGGTGLTVSWIVWGMPEIFVPLFASPKKKYFYPVALSLQAAGTGQGTAYFSADMCFLSVFLPI